jgi:hypothetical protein
VITPYPTSNPIVWAFSVNVTNAGNMPARRLSVRITCPSIDFVDDVTDTFQLASGWHPAQIASVLGPKQSVTVQGCEVPIMEDIHDAQGLHGRVLYLVEVRYLDGFLDAERLTQMSRALAFDKFGGHSLSFTSSHNCSDDDCPKSRRSRR